MDKEAKNTQSEQQEENRIQQNEDRVRSICVNFRDTNTCIMGVPKGEERKQGIKNSREKMTTENFHYLVTKQTYTPRKHRESQIRHIIIKMPKVKDKERICKAARKKQLELWLGSSAG